jgi:uncharacterized hydrophobic protein (TIGR00271 family)
MPVSRAAASWRAALEPRFASGPGSRRLSLGDTGGMLHFRITSPTGQTDDVLDALHDDPGISSLSVVRGAAMRPAGDLVLADVAREAADDVVGRLRSIGVHRGGSIHVEPVRTWLSRDGFEAERRTPGSSADSVVWAEVIQRAYEDTELNWTYASFMTLATMIATVAIVLDSQILVIGAMVLGPEFGAVAALGVALVNRRRSLFWRAARTLLVGFALAITLTTAFAIGAKLLGWITLDDVTGPRPGTEFIYFPDKWSFIVAVIAGAAGVLSLTSAKTGGLSGVFISVTTIPAAGNVALGLAFGASYEIWGSSLQLAINLSGMALAGWATLAIQRAVWSRVSAKRAGFIDRLHSRKGR